MHHTALKPFVIFSVAIAALISPLEADTVTIGTAGPSGNMAPFGDGYYSGEYQQIYSNTAFTTPFQITSLAFSSLNTSAATIQFNFTISLGITNRTPSSPGSTYSGTFAPVFTGMLTASITSTASDFDLVIPLATPFLYNPALGNLLLDVNLASATATSGSSPGYAYQTSTPLMGRVVNLSGSGAPIESPNAGLVTQFTGTDVPEPSTVVFIVGFLALFKVIMPSRAFQRMAFGRR